MIVNWALRTGLLASLLLVASCSKDNEVAVNQNCGDNSLECVPCSPDEFRCDGKTLRRCQSDGVGFDALMVCGSEALCVKGLDEGACVAPVCAAGDVRCDGKVMKICSDGLDGYDTKECASEGACEQGIAQAACVSIGGCTKATDCAGVDTDCAKRSCEDGECTMLFTSEGTQVALQTPGDCKVAVCDGQGAVAFVPFADDVPDDQNDCTVESCEGASPKITFAAAGTPCAGIGFCDGNGLCSKCTPGQAGPCANPSAESKCDGTGNWVEVPCTGLRDRCEGGRCVGGSTMAWVPAPGGGTYGIDAIEVTQAQYAEWLATSPSVSGQPLACQFNGTFEPATACLADMMCKQTGVDCKPQPQVCVDWCDATAYCKSMGKRLCGALGGGALPFDGVTDAETGQWHRSCTSGGIQSFPYGDGHEQDVCNNYDSHAGGCGEGQCSAWASGAMGECQSSVPGYEGVYDLSGNVWEWEDACLADVGKDDACRIRGSAFDVPFTNEAPGCAFLGSQARSTTSKANIGFRCCSD